MPISRKPPQAPKGNDICSKCGKKKDGRYFRSIRLGHPIFFCNGCHKENFAQFERNLSKIRKEMGIKIKVQKTLDFIIEGD